ncbi:D-Ala-D-Ala carboxypeptidase family metallohydrolase [bacterium]|nr:D-Ala-D-Ala carboxypeptidase family metallohydrolase [bacterium]
MKRISKHISYKEAVGSNYAKQKGIKNKPNEEQVENMKLLAEEVFEPLREWVDAPIKVNSMFRSLELNTALKGSKTSSHMKGEAMDITSMGGKSNLEMFHYIRTKLDFDQLIWEFGKEPKWLHVSFNKDKNRKQVLVTKKRGVYYTY